MRIEGFTIVTKKGKLVDKKCCAGYFSQVKKRIEGEVDAEGKQRIVPAVMIIDEADLVSK